jgi:DNA-directed RNA polymerase subunit M
MPQFWSLWQCHNCGYRGAFILEDGKLASKLQKDWKNKTTQQQ